MKRSRLGAALGLLALCASSGACIENEVSIAIAGNMVPQVGGIGGRCIVMGDPGSPQINNGLFDVGLRNTYQMYPLYRSQLIDDRDPTRGSPSSRYFNMMGVDVELYVGSATGPLINLGNAMLSQYQVNTSVVVPPATMSGAGYATGSLEVIPAVVGNALRNRVCRVLPPPAGQMCNRDRVDTAASTQIVVVLRPFGRTAGGVALQGGFFTYPLNVCCGCSVTFPPESRNMSIEGPNCQATGASGMMVCDPGQDGFLDCRLCQGNPLCTPVVCR